MVAGLWRKGFSVVHRLGGGGIPPLVSLLISTSMVVVLFLSIVSALPGPVVGPWFLLAHGHSHA